MLATYSYAHKRGGLIYLIKINGDYSYDKKLIYDVG